MYLALPNGSKKSYILDIREFVCHDLCVNCEMHYNQFFLPNFDCFFGGMMCSAVDGSMIFCIAFLVCLLFWFVGYVANSNFQYMNECYLPFLSPVRGHCLLRDIFLLD